MISRTRVSLLVTVALVNASPSWTHAASQQEQKCIAGMNKAGAKLCDATMRDAYECARDLWRYTLPPGVTGAQCLAEDPRGTVAKALERVNRAQAKLCSPAPSFGYTDPASILDVGEQLARDLVADVFGDGFAPGEVVVKCQTQLVRDLGSLTAAQLRAFIDCKRSGLQSGAIADSASLASCLSAVDDDARNKIGKSLERLAADTSDCEPFGLARLFPGYCVYSADFGSCLSTRARCRTCEALNRMDALSMDCEGFDDGIANGSCGACVPDPDGQCCNLADRDACGFCGGTGFRCNWAQVSVAPTHVCGRKLDGTISCWGDNVAGETDAPPGAFVDIASGGSNSAVVNRGHSCAIDASQNVTCWGSDEYGQSTPPAGPFTQVTAGDYHSCGLRPDGTIVCWGRSVEGQTAAPSGSFLRISTSRRSNCALRADGEVLCWGGNNLYGDLNPLAGPFVDIEKGPISTYATRPDQTVANWGGDNLPQFIPPPGAYAKVAAAQVNGCGLRLDGSIVCWPDPPVVPTVGPPSGTFIAIDAGERIYCGIRSDHVLICWGDIYTEAGAPPK